MPPPEPAESTRRVGPYRLVRRLGAGGMGAVFEGVHERTGARHALKLLRVPAGRDPEDLARFRREAALTARLEHPSIVRVHDLGLERPPYYIAMDLVEGGSLQARLDRDGALPIAAAVEIAARLAAALWHAHAHGVVHRDVKPANIILDADGAPRLADFGLARDGGAVLERLTHTGEVVGTPRYIAPEQVLDSRAVDGRADVYALGGVLFAMLTGQAPMPGDDVAQVFRAVRDHVPPPPSSLRPGVPPELDAICARALAKLPAERFASAAELLEALEAARRLLAPDTGSPGDAASRPRPPRARRTSVALLGAAAAAAAAVGALALAASRPHDMAAAAPPASLPPRPPPSEPASGPTLSFAVDREAPIRAPWSLRSLDGGALAVTVTLVDDDGGAPERARAGLAGGTERQATNDSSSRDAVERSRRAHHTDDVTGAATLLLDGRLVEATGDRAVVALRAAEALSWDGDAVLREGPHAPHAIAGLVGGEVRCTLVLSNGDVVEAVPDDVLTTAAGGLEARAPLLASLLRPGTIERLLVAVARAEPTEDVRWPLLPGRVARRDDVVVGALLEGELAHAGVRRYATLAVAAVDLRAPSEPGPEALRKLLRAGLRDMASLWLHNGLPPLDRPAAPRALVVPEATTFGAPAELVRVSGRARPVFASPWGSPVATLREGEVVAAHERRGEWRQVCVQGGSGWVLDRGALERASDAAEAVVVTDGQAYAYPNPERRRGTAVGIAPRGAGFVVRGRTDGVGDGPHLEIDYGGVRCWILERDARRLE